MGTDMTLKSFGIAMALTAAVTAAPARAGGPDYDVYGMVQAAPSSESRALVEELRAWGKWTPSNDSIFEKAVPLVGKDTGGKHLSGTRDCFAARLMRLEESVGRTQAALLFLKGATDYLKECRNVEASMDKSDAWMNGRFARMTEVEIRERCAEVLALEGPNVLAWLAFPVDKNEFGPLANVRNGWADPEFNFLPDVMEQLIWSGPWNSPNSEYDQDCVAYVHRMICGALAKTAARVLYVEKKFGKPDDERVIFEATNLGNLVGSYHAGMRRALQSRYNAMKAAEESDAMVKRILGGWGMVLGGGLIAPWELGAIAELAQAVGDVAVEHASERGNRAEDALTQGKVKKDKSCAAFRKLILTLLRASPTHMTPSRVALDAADEIEGTHDNQ
jgi:hypothetical protein